MYLSRARSLAVSALAVGVLGMVALDASQQARAQSGPSSERSTCFVAPAKLSDEKIDAFLSDPKGLIRTNTSGGLPMANQVRALAGSDSRALGALIALNADANAVQRAALGAGLARAAAACAATVPAYAALIQQQVAQLGRGELLAAFEAASADVETAALGGAAPGAGAGDTGALTGGAGNAGAGGAAGAVTGGTGTPTSSGSFSVGSAQQFTESEQSGSVSPTN